MTPAEQDLIDDIVTFAPIKQRGITAEVNMHFTIMKATTPDDVAVFNNIDINKHIRIDPGLYRTIKSKYPLLGLVMSVDKYSAPISLLYKNGKVLIAEYDGFVIGIAPVVDVYVN